MAGHPSTTRWLIIQPAACGVSLPLRRVAMDDQSVALLKVVTRDGAIETLIASIKMWHP